MVSQDMMTSYTTSRMRTSQNFWLFICESSSIFLFRSLFSILVVFCLLYSLFFIQNCGQPTFKERKKFNLQRVADKADSTLAVDFFSLKCYLSCEGNVVRISQNIQNEISLDTFCDVVAYKFINLYKLKANLVQEAKTCMIMHRSIWSDNDQSSRRVFKAIEITTLEEHFQSSCSFVFYGK